MCVQIKSIFITAAVAVEFSSKQGNGTWKGSKVKRGGGQKCAAFHRSNVLTESVVHLPLKTVPTFGWPAAQKGNVDTSNNSDKWSRNSINLAKLNQLIRVFLKR